MPPKKSQALAIYIYLLGHFLVKGIKHPQELVINIQRGLSVIKSKGIQQAKERLLTQYLPKNYSLKTKLHIQEPSYSVYKKLIPLFRTDFFRAPPVQTAEGMATRQRILVIRSGAMGDVLLATPIIRKIYQDREGFCEIDVATRNHEVFKNSPYVSSVLSPKDLKHLKQSYDLIINLDMALEKNKAAHITNVYSFFAFGSKSKNQVDLQPELFASSSDIEKVQKFIKNYPQKYMVCHNRVDPTQPYRNIPLSSWQDLLAQIAANTDIKIIQIGMPDMDVALSNHPNFIDARGQFNLQELKELIAHAQLFLGTDAGPLHVAACTNTPIVSFFTLAHHESRKPLRAGLEDLFKPITPQIDCYGCVKDYPLAWGFECRRGDFECTQKFNIQEAADAAMGFLKPN